MVNPGLPPATPRDDAAAAMAVIRRYCGWHVAPPVRETVVLTPERPGTRTLLLPTRHVTAIHTVTISEPPGRPDGVDVTGEVEWDKAGVLRYRGRRFPPHLRSVTVDMTHGWEWEDVPDLIGVYEALKTRAGWAASPIRSQTAGPYSVTYATRDGMPVGGLSLLGDEKTLLAPYRLEWGP